MEAAVCRISHADYTRNWRKVMCEAYYSKGGR